MAIGKGGVLVLSSRCMDDNVEYPQPTYIPIRSKSSCWKDINEMSRNQRPPLQSNNACRTNWEHASHRSPFVRDQWHSSRLGRWRQVINCTWPEACPFRSPRKRTDDKSSKRSVLSKANTKSNSLAKEKVIGNGIQGARL